MRIYAPVKDFNGLRNNVRFVNGVGETNDLKAIEWFKSHGYRVPVDELPTVIKAVEIVDDSEFVEINKLANEEPDLESMTPNELRDYAKANGLGGVIKNTRSKEKLLELIRG